MTNDESTATEAVGEAVCFPTSDPREANTFPDNKLAIARPKFGLRHSSFVIAAALALMLLTGCAGKRITKANVDQVAENMSKKQVESILGPPTEIDTKDFLVTKRTTYTYRQGSEQVTIVFKDDKVQSKESTFSD